MQPSAGQGLSPGRTSIPSHQRERARNSLWVKASPLLFEGVTNAQFPASFSNCETQRALVLAYASAYKHKFLFRYRLAELFAWLRRYRFLGRGRTIRFSSVGESRFWDVPCVWVDQCDTCLDIYIANSSTKTLSFGWIRFVHVSGESDRGNVGG